ncbi:hypothetical protein BC827DRAFT_292706 [Russula dissimulans]|nr:hypothetical protein BC827DRAFT_292706 [Russula dissimulans]
MIVLSDVRCTQRFSRGQAVVRVTSARHDCGERNRNSNAKAIQALTSSMTCRRIFGGPDTQRQAIVDAMSSVRGAASVVAQLITVWSWSRGKGGLSLSRRKGG